MQKHSALIAANIHVLEHPSFRRTPETENWDKAFG
jgi:hypothetical protein